MKYHVSILLLTLSLCLAFNPYQVSKMEELRDHTSRFFYELNNLPYLNEVDTFESEFLAPNFHSTTLLGDGTTYRQDNKTEFVIALTDILSLDYLTILPMLYEYPTETTVLSHAMVISEGVESFSILGPLNQTTNCHMRFQLEWIKTKGKWIIYSLQIIVYQRWEYVKSWDTNRYFHTGQASEWMNNIGFYVPSQTTSLIERNSALVGLILDSIDYIEKQPFALNLSTILSTYAPNYESVQNLSDLISFLKDNIRFIGIHLTIPERSASSSRAYVLVSTELVNNVSNPWNITTQDTFISVGYLEADFDYSNRVSCVTVDFQHVWVYPRSWKASSFSFNSPPQNPVTIPTPLPPVLDIKVQDLGDIEDVLIQLARSANDLMDFYEEQPYAPNVNEFADRFVSNESFIQAIFRDANGQSNDGLGSCRFSFETKTCWRDFGFDGFRKIFNHLNDYVTQPRVRIIERDNVTEEAIVIESSARVFLIFEYICNFAPLGAFNNQTTYVQESKLTIRWHKDSDGKWRFGKFMNQLYHRWQYSQVLSESGIPINSWRTFDFDHYSPRNADRSECAIIKTPSQVPTCNAPCTVIL